jgi:hypothetical protein
MSGTRVEDQTVFIGADDSTYVTTSSNPHSLTIWGDTLQIVSPRTPASSTATGNTGEICLDSNYLYFCYSTNNWKRIALSTF